MGKTPVGTARYKVTEFIQSSKVVLERVENYWQKDESANKAASFFSMANPKKITFLTIKESSQVVIALETGLIDFAVGMTMAETTRFDQGTSLGKGFTIFQNLGLSELIFLSGDKSSPFADDLYLRRAVLYALDKEGMIDAALGGYGKKAFTLGASGYSDSDPDWEKRDYYDFNIEKAKENLSKSNYKGQTLRYIVASADYQQKTALIIQSRLSEIGIKVEIIPQDGATFTVNQARPAVYDIVKNETIAVDFLTSTWINELDWRLFNGTTRYGVKYSELQKAFEIAVIPEGHTIENMDKIHKIMTDRAYCVGLFTMSDFHIGRSNLGECLYDCRGVPHIPSITFTN
jgi:ABC-type transport system substrate-binding protein